MKKDKFPQTSIFELIAFIIVIFLSLIIFITINYLIDKNGNVTAF